MTTGAQGVAVDQATPGGNAIGADGQPAPKKFALTAEEIRLLALEAARNGQDAHAARLAELIGEAAPKISYFQKPATRGDVLVLVGGTAVTGLAVYGSVRLVKYFRNRNQSPRTGKVIPMPPRAASGR